MDQTQAKPINKRRRRWLIVAFVAVLLASVSWWNWPRGDARFVGKWQLWDDNHNVQIGFETFESSGRCHVESTAGERGPFRAWKVSGEQLVYGWTQPDDLVGLESEIAMFIQRHVTRVVLFEGDRFDILFCSPDKIELRLSGSNRLTSLRRIPE